MSKEMDISVYGCPSAIKPLHERIVNSVETITKNYEIIMVNDHCPKDSWSIVAEEVEKDDHLVGINLSRNFGQMSAILAGLDYCSGDWIVVMDCDLQDRPEEIPNLYRKALEGYDTVFARRTDRKDKKTKVKTSHLFFKIFSYLTGMDYDPAVGNFSICSRKVIDNYLSMRELHRDYSSYIQWLGFNQAYIETHCEERFEGKSSYTFMKKLSYGIDMLTAQSDKIMRMIVGFGAIVTILAFVLIIVNCIRFFVMDIDPGWTSIVSAILLMGGLLISIQGVIGIYVGNIFMQSKNRPLYVIDEIRKRNDI